MTNTADLMIERSAMVLAHICTLAHGGKPRSVDLELIRTHARAAAQFVSAEEFFRKVIEKAQPYTVRTLITGFETMLDRMELENTLRTILLGKLSGQF
jgi:hypothetical protein